MSISTAEQLEDNEQYDKAYEEYKKVYAQRPNSVEILERLGHLAVILHKKPEAADYYKKMLELEPTNTLAYEQLMDIYADTDRYRYYISRGNLHIIQEEFSHAINDFKKALDKAQTEDETNSSRFILATLYEQVGKNHQAIDEYLRIIDTHNVTEIVFLKLAQVYLMEDSIASAIETLERALEGGFDTDNIRENLAQCYLKNSQPEKAREISLDPLVKAKSLLEEEKNEEAFKILDEVEESHKKDAQYYSLLAQYYFNMKDWEKSLEFVNEFDNLQKNSPLTYQMRALIFEEKGSDFDAHLNWAKYNMARNDKDVALNEYLSAYQIRDYDILLIKEIAELLDLMNDKNHAIEFWEKLLNVEPSNRKALEKIADFKENLGDYRGQAEILEKYISIDGKNASVIKKLAGVYEKIRNKDKALEYYQKFILISPVNEEYEQVQQKIKKLESSDYEEDTGLLDKLMGFFSKR